METCETCVFWVNTEGRGHREPGECGEEYRQCMSAADGCDDDSIKGVNGIPPMITSDGSGYWSCLETYKNHSCNEWKKK